MIGVSLSVGSGGKSLAAPKALPSTPHIFKSQRSTPRHQKSLGTKVYASSDIILPRRQLLATTIGLSTLPFLPQPAFSAGGLANSIYAPDLTALQYGEEIQLNKFKGKVLYLLEKYRDQGFEVLAAPCNQFGGQAPGTSEEERAAAYRKFGIDTFPILDKLLVNGPNTHPMYQILKKEQPVSQPSSSSAPVSRIQEPGIIEWNYVKFLVDRDGVPRKRFKPAFDPLEFEGDVRLLLAGKEPLPAECIAHPGRKVCNVDKLLEQA